MVCSAWRLGGFDWIGVLAKCNVVGLEASRVFPHARRSERWADIAHIHFVYIDLEICMYTYTLKFAIEETERNGVQACKPHG